MKRSKWLIFISIFFSISLSAQGNKMKLKLLGSYDFNNQYWIEDSDEVNINHNASAGIEILPFNNPYFLSGIGVEYQFPRKIKNSETEFTFIPVYLLFNALISENELQPFLSARFGYSFLNMYFGSPTDISFSGGFYYALGGGVKTMENFIFEILYSTQQGLVIPPKPFSEYDLYSTMISIKFGFLM